MHRLEAFVEMVVACAQEGCVNVGVLRAQLIRNGMDDEEVSLLLEIVALEARSNPPRVHAVRAVATCRRTIDMV